MTTQNLATSLGEGRDAAPSLAHPSQKPNPVVYTEELTHLKKAFGDEYVYAGLGTKTEMN